MLAFLNIAYVLTLRRKLSLLAACVILFMGTFGFSEIVYAQDMQAGAEIQAPNTEKPAEVFQFPYKQFFILSAYYSPLADQQYFLTGNYEAEIRLNGGGIRGADGTAVYPGMIAAPKKYPFGTKMSIPGIGTVAVHDRGGAIVEAGERGHSYDRLDVWMGSGEEGLRRALAFGKKTLEVTVYGIDPNIIEAVNLEGLPQAKYIIAQRATPRLFRHSLTLNDHGDQVAKLQSFLKHLGYLDGEVTGFYGKTTQEAVSKFQLDQDLIKALDDFNAGNFDVSTRLRLEAIISREKEKYAKELPARGLGKGDSGSDVEKLQKILMELGYLKNMSKIYDDTTIDAVLKFQVDQNLLDQETDRGAGYFGPQTESMLKQKYLAEKGGEMEKEYTKDAGLSAVKYFEQSLKIGDSGPDVLRLQDQLRQLNYLKVAPSGYYGDMTVHAVFKLQQRLGIVKKKNEMGAGVFGPNTRARINDLLVTRERTRKLIAVKTLEYNSAKLVAEKNPEAAVVAAQSKEKVVFAEDLRYGSSGAIVQTLQRALKELGFFTSSLTSEYFGQSTQKAIIAFQLANNLIESENVPGAGDLDQKTREVLNRILQS